MWSLLLVLWFLHAVCHSLKQSENTWVKPKVTTVDCTCWTWMLTRWEAVSLVCAQIVGFPPSSAPCRCRCDRMCFRVSSSCVSCPILICSFWFSSCSCIALCWVSRILLRALSRLFLTAMLFLSRLSRYSALSLLMLLLFTGGLRVGRRKTEKSWRS